MIFALCVIGVAANAVNGVPRAGLVDAGSVQIGASMSFIGVSASKSENCCSGVIQMIVTLAALGLYVAWHGRAKSTVSALDIQGAGVVKPKPPSCKVPIVVDAHNVSFEGVWSTLVSEEQQILDFAKPVAEAIAAIPEMPVLSVVCVGVDRRGAKPIVDLVVIPKDCRCDEGFADQAPRYVKTMLANVHCNFSEAKVEVQELSLTLHLRECTIMLSVAPRLHLRSSALMPAIKKTAPANRKAFQPALRVQWVKLLQQQRDTVQRAAALLKWWTGQQGFSTTFAHPPPRMVESVALYVGSTSKDLSLEQLVMKSMEVIGDLGELKVRWCDELSDLSIYEPGEVQRNVRSQKPLLMDPVNPFNNLLNKRIFGVEELVAAARGSWIDTFKKIVPTSAAIQIDTEIVSVPGEVGAAPAARTPGIDAVPAAETAPAVQAKPTALAQATNAWRPGAQRSPQATIRSMLNKVTLQNVREMKLKFLEMSQNRDVVSDAESMTWLAQTIYSHSIRQPHQSFAALYADILSLLVRSAPSFPKDGRTYTFAEALLGCIGRELMEIPDPGEVMQQQWSSIDDREVAYNLLKDRVLGQLVLLGELYVRGAVHGSVLRGVMGELLSGPRVVEQHIEGLLKMLCIAKSVLIRSDEGKRSMHDGVSRISQIAAAGLVSKRVQFIISDAMAPLSEGLAAL